MKTKLMLGDNIESLKKLPDNSIDSVVTDPPYGLSFMNKKWDYDVPSVDFWKEVYRVLKPGGHILSFGGTRTYHRMVVNIEDAGFEIRDQIMWLYGSGFPKSHNIGKAVDKLEGNEREIVGERVADDITSGNFHAENKGQRTTINITKGSSPYEGWGSSMKPANEPICLARKPLSEKSIVENVLKWGTGGINIDGCRVGSEIIKTNGVGGNNNTVNILCKRDDFNGETHEGRFPANLILECICDNREESESHENPMCPCRLLDEQSGNIKSSKFKEGYDGGFGAESNSYINHKPGGSIVKNERGYSDKGGASRFFYQAKVSKSERNMGLDGFEVQILTPTMKLLLKTDYNNKNFIWEKEELKTKLVDTDKSHQKDIEEFGAQQNEDKLWNTELFGKVITEQFLMDVKSTILTATNLTTIYQTLNLLIQKNIKTNIQELNGLMVKDIKLVSDVENKNIKMNFTLQIKDGYSQNVNVVELNEVWTLNAKENKCGHPTLKPVNLMTYLCRLITPQGGIVLDPFMGSGSTGISALLEGFRFVGMEMDEDYFKIASARIENYEKYRKFIK